MTTQVLTTSTGSAIATSPGNLVVSTGSTGGGGGGGGGGGPTGPTITTVSLPGASSGTSYSDQLTASGGTAPLTWSLVSSIGLNSWAVSSSGLLTGTPTVAETDSLTVKVTDANSLSASMTLPITIASSGGGTSPLVFQPVYDPGYARPWSITAASVVGNVVTLTISKSGGLVGGNFGDYFTPAVGQYIYIQGVTGATGYNGPWMISSTSSSTIISFVSAGVSGTPVFTNAICSIFSSICLTDANGNHPVQNSAFSAPILVQGGTPPYTYSFYQFPQSTLTTTSGYSGFWNGSTNVVAGNAWSINSSTGVVTGTPGVSEQNILYVQVADSASNVIQSMFIVGVMPQNVGNGYYATGSLRQAVFGAIPSYISTTPTGYPTSGLTGPNMLTTGYSATLLTPNLTTANSVTIQNTNPSASDGGYTNGQQYTCTKSNCTYTLTCDMSSPTWCINVLADKVCINLNGHTLTYMTAPVAPTDAFNDRTAFGIGSAAPNYTKTYTYLEFLNGFIQNGAGKVINAMSGNYGAGPCPIVFTEESNSPNCQLQIRNIYFKWNTYSVGAINLHGFYINQPGSLVEYCTFEDYGWNVQDRQFPPAHTGFTEAFNIVRNCRFIAARQVAVGPALNVYNNEIWQDGWWTNSEAINVEATNQQVYGNNIYMTGNHPQSLFVGATNLSTAPANAYGNWVEGMYTRVACQFPNGTSGLDSPENFADGITIRFGQPQYNNIYGNTMLIHAKSNTVWNPKTASYQNSTARGFWYNAANSTLANSVYNNTICANALDTSVKAYGLRCSGNGNGLTVGGTASNTANRIISNRVSFGMADDYGYYEGFTNNALIIGNYIELQSSLGSGYSTFAQDAQTYAITGGAITNLALSGSTVTMTYTPGQASIGAGSTITVSGVTIDPNYNGTFIAVTAGNGTLTYVPTTTPTAQGAATGSVSGTVSVQVTFQNNTWAHGTWTGGTTPSTFNITGTGGGASGTTPVIYNNLGPNMTYSFINEPGAVL